MPDIYLGFHITYRGKKLLKEEIFALYQIYLSLGDREDFYRYLSSPYFFPDTPIGELYRRCALSFAKRSKYLQGEPLLMALFPTRPVERSLPDLRRLAARLANVYPAYLYARDCHRKPAPETAAYRSRLLKGHGAEDKYRATLEERHRLISQLPTGTRRALQAWSLAHDSHYAPEFRKERASDTSPAPAAAHLSAFTRLVAAQYRLEDLGRQQLFSSEPFPLAPASSLSATEGLVHLYDLAADLFVHPPTDNDRLLRFRIAYGGLYEQLDKEHVLTLFIAVTNALSIAFRKGQTGMVSEMKHWSEFMLHRGIYRQYPTVSKSFYLNRLQEAYIINDAALTKCVRDTLKPRLPTDERKEVAAIDRIAEHFYADEHAEVSSYFSNRRERKKKDRYLEGLRMQSFRLRSELCLQVGTGGDLADFNRAAQNFGAIMKRSMKPLSRDRKLALQRFFSLSKKIRIASTSGWKSEQHARLLAEIREAQPLHARRWLLSLVLHFDPDRLTQDYNVKPTVNWRGGD